MIKTIYIYILIIILIMPLACIEPYSVIISDSDQVLVVEGMITNDPGPYTVYLSRTTSATERRGNCKTGCRFLLP